MMTCRRILRIIGPLVVLSGLVAACSSGSSSSTTTTLTKLATGKVTCTGITGTIAFVPPLTNSGSKAEITHVTLTASGCSTAGSNVATLTSGRGSATITDSTNSCAGITTSKPVKVTVVWTPATVRPTVVSFSGYKVAANASGEYGFTLPDTGGSATVTGSFAGPTASAATYSNSTAAQIAAACGSSAGLTTLSLSSGSFSIG